MVTVSFYGASDDLVYVTDPQGEEEEYGAYSTNSDINAIFELKGPDGSMRVLAIYGPNGCWAFAPALVDEDIPLPPWPISVKLGGRGYSVQLDIEVPENTFIRRVD